jgi:outer membrane lipoprotein SlyB
MKRLSILLALLFAAGSASSHEWEHEHEHDRWEGHRHHQFYQDRETVIIQQPYYYISPPVYVPQVCHSCGRVEAVYPITVYTRPTGVGVIGGGIIGGLLGNQIGNGNGRTAATIVGALGGSYIGNEVERRQATTIYRVSIRMDDSSHRRVDYQQPPGVYAGDRVHFERGQLIRG